MSGKGPNKAASVLTKLKTLAVKEQVGFNLLVARYVQGRFLYRLSLSPYVKHFILKGGLLLFAWSGLETRPTRDMDVLVENMQNDAAQVAAVFKDICLIDVNDGVKYHENTVDVKPIQEEDKYMGLRVKFIAMIGTKTPGRVEARLAARPPHRTGLALLRHPALHNSIYR